MNRLEFINALGARLQALSQPETAKILDYYVESIDDRIEDGMCEEDAIASLGDLDQLAANILAEQGQLTVPAAPMPAGDTIPATVYREKQPIRWWVILLLVLGSPIWLGLGAGLLGVLFGVYAIVWALLISLWAIAVSFTAGGVAGAILTPFAPVAPDTAAVRLFGAGILLAMAGVGILLLPLSWKLTKEFLRLHRRIFPWIRSRIKTRREAM